MLICLYQLYLFVMWNDPFIVLYTISDVLSNLLNAIRPRHTIPWGPRYNVWHCGARGYRCNVFDVTHWQRFLMWGRRYDILFTVVVISRCDDQRSISQLLLLWWNWLCNRLRLVSVTLSSWLHNVVEVKAILEGRGSDDILSLILRTIDVKLLHLFHAFASKVLKIPQAAIVFYVVNNCS